MTGRTLRFSRLRCWLLLMNKSGYCFLIILMQTRKSAPGSLRSYCINLMSGGSLKFLHRKASNESVSRVQTSTARKIFFYMPATVRGSQI